MSKLWRRLLVPALLFVLALSKPGPAQQPDFNGDGYADLAVGVPGESVKKKGGAGAVNVLYGTASAISAAGNQLWHRDVAGVLGTADAGDAFGSSIAWGDFNDDGYSDLAVGAPRDDRVLRTGG